MSLLENTDEISKEFNDSDIKKEIVKDSNEFDPSTQKVEESCLMSTSLEPNWNIYVKVDEEGESSLKYSFIADLVMKEEYEDQDTRIEISDDPNKYPKTTESEETPPLSDSNINLPNQKKNRHKESHIIIDNDGLTAEKVQRRNPKRNCSQRSYLEDTNNIESGFFGKGNESCSTTTVMDNLRDFGVGNGKKPYDCPHCYKKFRDSYSLEGHLRVHTGERPYGCPQCNKKFTCPHHLKSHLRIHTGEKPYNCSHCNKKFAEPGTLKRHIRTHTGEKPYACPQCFKQFARPGPLKTHLRSHRREKLYECSRCSKKFAKITTLKRHSKIHSEKKWKEMETSK